MSRNPAEVYPSFINAYCLCHQGSDQTTLRNILQDSHLPPYSPPRESEISQILSCKSHNLCDIKKPTLQRTAGCCRKTTKGYKCTVITKSCREPKAAHSLLRTRLRNLLRANCKLTVSNCLQHPCLNSKCNYMFRYFFIFNIVKQFKDHRSRKLDTQALAPRVRFSLEMRICTCASVLGHRVSYVHTDPGGCRNPPPPPAVKEVKPSGGKLSKSWQKAIQQS